jgi:hypothetical protein
LIKEKFGDITFEVDGVVRDHVAWREWAVTTRVSTANYWRTAVEAVLCHQSQLPSLGDFASLPDEVQQRFWANNTFYRVFSLVNGGRTIEDDLFAGLRGS